MPIQSIIERYKRLRRRVHERLTHVNSITERAVLAAGDQLQTVVATARSHIESLRSLLAGPLGSSDSALALAIEGHVRHTRQSGAALVSAVTEHAQQVEMVAEQARMITAAAAQIERTNAAARMLSLNARIDAARSGMSSFKTVATEMQELSRAIGEANQHIRDLATAMNSTLPRLVAQSQSLRDMVGESTRVCEETIAQIDGEVSAMRQSASASLLASDRALELILKASFDGLSELQFQDVCAQSLLQIDAWHAEELEEVAELTGVETDVEAPSDSVSQEDGILERPMHGELMLL